METCLADQDRASLPQPFDHSRIVVGNEIPQDL